MLKYVRDFLNEQLENESNLHKKSIILSLMNFRRLLWIKILILQLRYSNGSVNISSIY